MFESATIDPATNSLKLKVNRYVDDQIVMSSNEYVVLQSYIKDSAGKKVVNGNHIVKINVNGNAIVDMQLAVSSDYEFSSEKTYIYSMLTDKDKVLSMLNPENEVFMDKVYLSQKNRVLYFKIRLVFANNEVMYVTDKCQFSGVSTGTTIEKNEEVDAILLGSKSKDMESFIVTLPAAYSPSREMVTRTFRFIILEENEKIDLSQLYTVHDGIYTYTYFDNRYKRMDSIVDREGNIVEFTGDKTGSIYTIRDDDDAGKKDGYVSSFTKTDTSVSPISGDE